MANATEPVAAQTAPQTKEEGILPKLSMADFRVYNGMAEHMDYFVGISIGHVMGAPGPNTHLAQQLPANVESPLCSLHQWQASSKHVHPTVFVHWSTVLPSPAYASRDRGSPYLPCAG